MLYSTAGYSFRPTNRLRYERALAYEPTAVRKSPWRTYGYCTVYSKRLIFANNQKVLLPNIRRFNDQNEKQVRSVPIESRWLHLHRGRNVTPRSKMTYAHENSPSSLVQRIAMPPIGLSAMPKKYGGIPIQRAHHKAYENDNHDNNTGKSTSTSAALAALSRSNL